jgi:tRNA A37 threonylcarbamoyladenosine dehydratase
MLSDWLIRTEVLIGKEKLHKLRNSRVTIIGLGGVGSYVAENIARSGVNNILLIDYDTVSESNVNRQLIALNSTLGMYKTNVMRDRILDINPEANISIFSEFLHKDNRLNLIKDSDYIIDAIDSIGPKIGTIKELCELNIPFISVLGAGNRINPDTIKITSIWKVEGCPFAKRIKKLLRKHNVVADFPVVFSDESPICRGELHSYVATNTTYIPKSIVGSISYMPAIMGSMAAGKVIYDIINNNT